MYSDSQQFVDVISRVQVSSSSRVYSTLHHWLPLFSSTSIMLTLWVNCRLFIYNATLLLRWYLNLNRRLCFFAKSAQNQWFFWHLTMCWF